MCYYLKICVMYMPIFFFNHHGYNSPYPHLRLKKKIFRLVKLESFEFNSCFVSTRYWFKNILAEQEHSFSLIEKGVEFDQWLPHSILTRYSLDQHIFNSTRYFLLPLFGYVRPIIKISNFRNINPP